MRAATFADHRKRVGRAVAHVDWHLDDDLDMRRLADAACFSPYHFLRVFQELTRETPLAMVRRLRLERSRRSLAAGASVMQAAEEARFESPQAFARAFRSLFGLTPSSVPPEEIPSALPVNEIEIVALAPRRAITLDFSGIYIGLTDAFGHFLGLTRPLTDRYASSAAAISDDHPFHDLDQPYACRMLIVMSEDGLRETRLPVAVLPGGLHAVWRRRGLLADSRDAYARLIDHDLPARGYRKTEGPIIRLFHNDPALVTRANRKWSLVVPVTPLAA
ncbi:MAG: helix-turn-helix domain-containing protein [Parvibaculaceae bacterium]